MIVIKKINVFQRSTANLYSVSPEIHVMLVLSPFLLNTNFIQWPD